ncbi:MAG: Flp pilus assembly protein CpaB [Gammaproteobacteria bacterium]|nr:Flp pilus assembly protein CpaB [Gammaproteobacteria bacterium]
MMRRRGTLLVALSLVFGILAAWGANSWVAGRLAGEADEDKNNVVAASMQIPYGTKIESRHLKMVDLPLEAVPDGSIALIDDVVGMVSTVDIDRGEVLNLGRLAAHEKGSTLAALIDSNMRAITVRVDDVVGVAGFLLPGNRVDVLSSRLDMRTKRATIETILKNLKVLAVDQTASTEHDEPVIVRAVTLEVTPEQSETLVKAKEEGTIQLTLRNPLERAVVAVPKRKPASRVAAPVRAPKKAYRATSTTVQVIRGTTVNNKKVRI